jgi:hypothetical protein
MIVSCVFGPDPDNSDHEAIMRNHRNRLLAESDWAMTSDAPTDKQAWATYRQALRDFPATWTAGPVAEFPDPPGGE